ncbi:MAG TPA: hypothetical protein VJB14_13675 [Planctomycetota bacterium]|nr:hypothetical protein [Planctomycetota bacterium]
MVSWWAMGPFFKIPLNLPHAATISVRILYLLRQGRPAPAAIEVASRLVILLEPFRDREDKGEADEAGRATREAAALGRAIVDEVERAGAGTDRLGQQVRNLFECLELGEEGARVSLRAGENPNSLLRPT